MLLENPIQTKNILLKAINQKDCSIHEPLEGIGNRSFEHNGAEFVPNSIQNQFIECDI